MTLAADLSPLSRSKKLKAETSDIHARLDRRIMAAEPFASRANYARFLAVQLGFHDDVDALYRSPALVALLPELAARNRRDKVAADLADLGGDARTGGEPRLAGDALDLPTALGWLYVAEGSTIGAAFLFKMAGDLGLDAGFGARHLAGHPDGRAQHWREFIAALDAVELDAAEEARLVAGARAAFARVHALVDATFR